MKRDEAGNYRCARLVESAIRRHSRLRPGALPQEPGNRLLSNPRASISSDQPEILGSQIPEAVSSALRRTSRYARNLDPASKIGELSSPDARRRTRSKSAPAPALVSVDEPRIKKQRVVIDRVVHAPYASVEIWAETVAICRSAMILEIMLIRDAKSGVRPRVEAWSAMTERHVGQIKCQTHSIRQAERRQSEWIDEGVSVKYVVPRSPDIEEADRAGDPPVSDIFGRSLRLVRVLARLVEPPTPVPKGRTPSPLMTRCANVQFSCCCSLILEKLSVAARRVLASMDAINACRCCAMRNTIFRSKR